jgi:hypothetical protein
MQGLGGTPAGLNRAASMGGNKPGTAADLDPLKFQCSGQSDNGGPAISTSFTAEKGGQYKFVAWGAGTHSNNFGGSLAIRTFRMARDQTIPITVGSAYNTSNDPHTYIYFPDVTMTAGGNGSAASGGDYNSAGQSTAAAASYGNYQGGQGLNRSPGGAQVGGMVFVYYVGV